ncbi:RNA binding protein, putative [Theileria annulata]|uniref:RNA binding protein, putative n=1 Tax=Theileria annulata TaxID=5874 RepID=Q4UEP2_THEAN|nr:RNA binding protein, putative [Theileria annulata]CAI74447.1 RNA binding protein, putative [Theileria annulata]|eukprot:XP_952179.1 RNA binding protein, putative [Theileria annulata]
MLNSVYPSKKNIRLPPEVSRILYLRNLPYKITSEELYDIFGKYGSVRQIRKGNSATTKGTAFVVYDDIFDAKNALDHLSGFNVAGRYLVVLYYNPARVNKRKDLDKQEADLKRIRTAMNQNN